MTVIGSVLGFIGFPAGSGGGGAGLGEIVANDLAHRGASDLVAIPGHFAAITKSVERLNPNPVGGDAVRSDARASKAEAEADVLQIVSAADLRYANAEARKVTTMINHNLRLYQIKSTVAQAQARAGKAGAKTRLQNQMLAASTNEAIRVYSEGRAPVYNF